MRTVIGIGIAAVVAIGLFWSLAAMSKWVPVASAEISAVGGTDVPSNSTAAFGH